MRVDHRRGVQSTEGLKNAEIAENLAREKKLEVAKDLADLRVKIELIEEDLGIQDGSELSEDGL